jgi:hypothetical protein
MPLTLPVIIPTQIPIFQNSIGSRPILLGGNVPVADSLPEGSSVELYYNGFSFGPLTKITRFSVKPRLDPARNVVVNEFEMEVDSIITSPDPLTCDEFVEDVRRQLTKAGGELSISGKAVGNHWVNSFEPLAPKDVEKGPIYTALDFEPLGGGVTCGVKFGIRWVVPDCDDAVYDSFLGFLEHTYSIQTNVNDGYTTRSIKGRLVIPQSRADSGSRFPADSADRQKPYLAIKHPLPTQFAFRRSWQFNLSEDRAKLDYTITDTEMDYEAPPPGCLKADESYEISTQPGSALVSWTATLSGRYEVPRYGNIQDAVNAFFETMLQKISACESIRLTTKRGEVPTAVVPLAASLRQPNIRGRRVAELSVTWMVTGSLRDILERSGLWTRVSNGDHVLWAVSMDGVRDDFGLPASPFDPRGNIQAFFDFDVATDEVEDLCRPGEPPPESQNQPPNRNAQEEIQSLITPRPNASWIGYESNLEWEDEDGYATVRTLPTTSEGLGDTTLTPGSFDASDPDAIQQAMDTILPLFWWLGFGSTDETEDGTSGGSGISTGADEGGEEEEDDGLPEDDGSGATWVEGRSRTQRFIRHTGSALRYGFPIPEPVLTKVLIDGEEYEVKRAVRPDRGENFRYRTIALPNFFGGMQPAPLYKAEWDIRYGVVGNPPSNGKIGVLPNPITGE